MKRQVGIGVRRTGALTPPPHCLVSGEPRAGAVVGFGEFGGGFCGGGGEVGHADVRALTLPSRRARGYLLSHCRCLFWSTF